MNALGSLAVATFLASLPSIAASADDGLLLESYQTIRTMAECRDKVGIGPSSSFPLPIRGSSGVRYRQMFYRTLSNGPENAPDQQVLAPKVFAEYNLDGTALTCDLEIQMPDSEFGKPVGAWNTPETRGISRAAWLKQVTKLLAATQILGESFMNRRSDATTRATAKEFRRLFKTLSEPGLTPYYRALSPDFWKWLDTLEKGTKLAPKK
jgi:hypothetical protein